VNKQLNLSEVLISLFLVILGALVARGGLGYGLGTMARPGAGAFPLIVGVLLSGIGLMLFVSFCRSATSAVRMEIHSIAAVLASLVAFGLMVRQLGILPATTAAVVIASFAQPGMRVFEVVVLALIASALTVFLFIYGLGLPLRVVAW
jgi:hypothetical protein